MLLLFVFIGNFAKSDKKDALMITICVPAADNEHAKESH